MSQTPLNFPREEFSKVAFSTEHDLNTSEQQAFWQTVVQDTLKTPDGLTLAYMMVKHPQAHASIVISSGRGESY